MNFLNVSSYFFIILMCIASAPAAGQTAADTAEHAVKNRVERPVRDSIDIRQGTQAQREKWTKEREKMVRLLEQLQSENQRLLSERNGLISKNRASSKRIAVKEKELEGIRRMSKDTLPFLKETLSWLQGEIKNNMPFLALERRERVAGLSAFIDDPDVSISEKFRKIMEAMLIEAEYGTSVEVISESIEMDGEPVLVNVFRLGRLNLFYQTLNKEGCGFYNMASGKWERLSDKYNRQISRAFDMALKRRPVEMVDLPVGRVVAQ